jgi:hypothetical protein
MLSVSKVLRDVVNEYIDEVAEKFSLDKAQLLEMWSAKNSSVGETNSLSSEDDVAKLNALKKAELISLCKQKGLKCTGNKEELISYIIGNVQPKQNLKTSSKKDTKSPPKKKIQKDDIKPIIKKLVANIPVISIHKNQFGNFEHAETGLVLNKSHKVVGKQNSNGTIDDLTSDDINICNKYKFSFVVPSNLDKKLTLDNIHVEELDDEEKQSCKVVDEDVDVDMDAEAEDIEIEEEIELEDEEFEEEYEEEYEE